MPSTFKTINVDKSTWNQLTELAQADGRFIKKIVQQLVEEHYAAFQAKQVKTANKRAAKRI